MYIPRLLARELARFPKSLLLLGPRQTGKSTLIRSLKPDLEICFADQETYVRYLSDPGRIRKAIGSGVKTIFIDEVQRLPSILNTVQYLLDQRRDLRFYLTGSSARKLRRGRANLLPGRVLTFSLGPLTPLELGERFDLDRALSVGLLPGIYTEEDEALARKQLRSYAATYLREEIQAEALTRDMEGFSRFFEVVVEQSGNFIDFSKYASQAMIERMTARRYFDVLVDTMAVVPVGPFSKSRTRRLIQHPKHYFFDVGVLNGALGNFQPSPDRAGRLFEHLLLQAILATASGQDEDIRVTTYRTEAGAEVDFIVERGSRVFAVEAKASRNVAERDLRGLRSFAEFFGKKHTPLVAYLGQERLEIGGVRILPFAEACEVIAS